VKLEPLPPGIKPMTPAQSSMVAQHQGLNHHFNNIFPQKNYDAMNEIRFRLTSPNSPEARGLLSGFNTYSTPRMGFNHRDQPI
jgi:hypothetical protein